MDRSGVRTWKWKNLVVGAIFLLIGLAVLLAGLNSSSIDARLQAEGQRMNATMIEAREVQRTRRGVKMSTDYEVKYRFVPGGSVTAGGSVIVSDWMDTPEAVAREAARRGTIEIVYLAGEPALNKPVASLGSGVGSFSFPIGQALVAVIFAGVGLLILLSGRSGVAGARAPAATGQATGATVGDGPSA